MFPRLPARATSVADTKFLFETKKNVSDFFQKHFVTAANVSRFALHGNKTFVLHPARLPPKKHHEQQCALVCHRLEDKLYFKRGTERVEKGMVRMLELFSKQKLKEIKGQQ